MQMRSTFGDLNNKLKDIEKGLADRPGEEQIADMMKTLEADLAERFGDSRTIQIILENLKLDLRKKTTKTDVLGLVNGVVEVSETELRTLNFGLWSVDCGRALARGANLSATTVLILNRYQLLSYQFSCRTLKRRWQCQMIR